MRTETNEKQPQRALIGVSHVEALKKEQAPILSVESSLATKAIPKKLWERVLSKEINTQLERLEGGLRL